MNIRTIYLLVALGSAACQSQETKQAAGNVQILPDAPSPIEAAIQAKFPGAMPMHVCADSLIRFMDHRFSIKPNQMLIGASTCVDDIIYTKNFHLHPELKGPFHLGGLAGLPFTGISGLKAFGHHIPEGGTMVLFVEPHIGYSEKEGWGYILRHEQDEMSTCCGALMGTLTELQKNSFAPKITEDDYQGSKIAELAYTHRDEILNAPAPIIELTKVISIEAERQIRAHVLEIDMHDVRYIVIITGILINTDYMYTDYNYIDHVSVYDTNQKKFVLDLATRPNPKL